MRLRLTRIPSRPLREVSGVRFSQDGACMAGGGVNLKRGRGATNPGRMLPPVECYPRPNARATRTRLTSDGRGGGG